MTNESVGFAYFRCPRCELNYIRLEEGYCAVCKAEMRVPGYTLIPEDEVYKPYKEIYDYTYIRQGLRIRRYRDGD